MTHPCTLRAIVALLATAATTSAQWTLKSPAVSPSARVGAAIDYVPQNNALVMFGGGSPFLTDETWVYDGGSWTQLSPATSPSGRAGGHLVYDWARGVAVLYGGLASNISIPPPSNETWEWDGTNWSLATPANSAGPRYRYAACFDLLRSRLVMYGGSDSQLLGIPNSETWEYEGTNWSLASTTGNPGPRDRPSMCFHEGIGQAVLFGGFDGFGVSDETWAYDGVAGTWTQVALNGPRPSARNAAQMVYDATRGVCVLNGGQDASGILTDTWTFDGTSWLEQPTVAPPALPPARDHMLAFLPASNQVVRFGGFEAPPNTLSDQTWELGGGIYGSGCTGASGVPELRTGSAPTIGQSWSVSLTNLNPTFNVAFLALGLTQQPGLDLGPILGMPGCAAFATPDVLISLNGGSGSAGWTWPTVAGPPGATLYAQALCLDPPANTFGFTISNALYTTLIN